MQPFAAGGTSETLVEAREPDVGTCAVQIHRGREVHRIVGSQSVTLGEGAGPPDDRIADIDDAVRRPFIVEVGNRPP